jgi:hypothetical protein
MDAVSIATFTTSLASSQSTQASGRLTDGEAAFFAVSVSILAVIFIYEWLRN